MKHVFALASSLIVSVFIQKTTALKTLFSLLICALKGSDWAQTMELKEGTSDLKKYGHKLYTPFVSAAAPIATVS